jgi:hypothetical protein
MEQIHTAIPCKVVNVYGNLEQQKVDVIPSVDNLMKDGSAEPGMQILGVPVIFPGSQTTLISYPINVGDTVMCIFAQRSMDNFKIGSGEPTIANDSRKFSDQDAVAIPGLFPFSKSLNNPQVRKYPHDSNRDLCIAHNIGSGTEVNIILKQNGDLIINTDYNVVINSQTVQVNAASHIGMTAPRIDLTGNVSVSTGATGTFTTTTGAVVTVVDGIVTNIY